MWHVGAIVIRWWLILLAYDTAPSRTVMSRLLAQFVMSYLSFQWPYCSVCSTGNVSTKSVDFTVIVFNKYHVFTETSLYFLFLVQYKIQDTGCHILMFKRRTKHNTALYHMPRQQLIYHNDVTGHMGIATMVRMASYIAISPLHSFLFNYVFWSIFGGRLEQLSTTL